MSAKSSHHAWDMEHAQYMAAMPMSSLSLPGALGLCSRSKDTASQREQ